MSIAVVHSRALAGVCPVAVDVEVHLTNGLPGFSIVGLPAAAVKESKERVRSALVTSEFEFPARRITVNLAPADLPKEGGRFDLPIAIGILAASGQLTGCVLAAHEFLAELALTGHLRAVRGVLPAALACKRAGRALVIAEDNAPEAGLVGGLQGLGAGHLLHVVATLHDGAPPTPFAPPPPLPATGATPDLSDVRGQWAAKRALTVAAAGGHSVLMVGPPGTGKSMLAARLPGLLPDLDEDEALATGAVYSSSNTGLDPMRWRQRPFRTPHHSASTVALVGGGRQPGPGEVSLAHNGVLFLDELPEFDRRALEQLREPLETGSVSISRAAARVEYPARFQLVAAMNPCPCGWQGDPNGRCVCTVEQVERYRARLSGPLLDRIDIRIPVPPVPRRVLQDTLQAGEASATVRARVLAARRRQYARAGALNHCLEVPALEATCILEERARTLIDTAMDRFGLSARAYHRTLRVARSIADLAGHEEIDAADAAEALNYRILERADGKDSSG